MTSPRSRRRPRRFRQREARSASELREVRLLFLEYAGEIGQSLGFQDFLGEAARLPGPYRPPAGRLRLLIAGGHVAGCGALRRFGPGTAEVKRLYVRPAFRRAGGGRALLRTLLRAARAEGYSRVVLDTLGTMRGAQALYRAVGFREIPAYRPNPLPGARFFALECGGPRQQGPPRRRHRPR